MTSDDASPPVDPIEQLVRTAGESEADSSPTIASRRDSELTTPRLSIRAQHQPAAEELRGRVIMVTGAGSGIGRAVALALARPAPKSSCSAAPCASSKPCTPRSRSSARPKPASCRSTWNARWPRTTRPWPPPCEKRYGRLDGLLHNAALLGALTPIEQYDVPTFMRVMHVNVTAAFVLTQHLLPLLRASKDAAVLFTSSGVGKRGRAYWGAYSISKFAVEGFTQVLAQELESTSPVRVNIIDPGKVRTAMRRQAYPSEAAGVAADAGIADCALSRLVRPGEPWRHWAAVFGSSRLEQGLDLVVFELAELAARQALVELQTTHRDAQHAAHQRTLALEQLADVLAAGAAHHDRIPAIRAFELALRWWRRSRRSCATPGRSCRSSRPRC